VNASCLEIDDEEHEIPYEPSAREHSTLKKSAAAMTPQCTLRKVFQGMLLPRKGTGSIPCALRMRWWWTVRGRSPCS
jgi:hypothetical protein